MGIVKTGSRRIEGGLGGLWLIRVQKRARASECLQTLGNCRDLRVRPAIRGGQPFGVHGLHEVDLISIASLLQERGREFPCRSEASCRLAPFVHPSRPVRRKYLVNQATCN